MITALRGCDLIVHLGDLTSIGVLDRLAESGAEVVGIRNPKLDPPVGADPQLVDGPLIRQLQGRPLAMLREYPADEISADVIAYGVPAAAADTITASRSSAQRSSSHQAAPTCQYATPPSPD